MSISVEVWWQYVAPTDKQGYSQGRRSVFIPYKVKIPIRRFPYITVALIATNVLVFLLTSDGEEVYRSAVAKYALRWGASPLITYFTSMFLHGGIFHLLGNMLFLWVFGQAVEDRLGPVVYAGLYLLSGLAGGVAWHAATRPHTLGFGASGCISGVLGAYWYLYSWSPVRVLYCIAWLWQGTFELAAAWVIGAYFAVDLCWGLVDKVNDVHSGTAYFAHLGGTFIGALVVWALRFKRDSRNVSAVKANLSDCGGDTSLMNCSDLRVLVEQSGKDEDLLVDYARAAMLDNSPNDLRVALANNPMAIITHCPDVAEHCLQTLKRDPCAFTADTLLYLATWCEAHAQTLLALHLYDVVAARATDSRSAEIASYRAAGISWRQFRDGAAAIERLDALLARFPRGVLVLDAEDLRDEIRRLVLDAEDLPDDLAA